MIRITDQYFWNVIFLAFFAMLVVLGAIILETEARIAFEKLTIVDFSLLALATWRLTQFVTVDHVTKWLREQFYDVKKVGKGYTLEKPKFGPRRAIADILTSPWVFGLAASAGLTFFYLSTVYAYYCVLLLAIAALGSFLQTLSALITWHTEKIKQEIE